MPYISELLDNKITDSTESAVGKLKDRVGFQDVGQAEDVKVHRMVAYHQRVHGQVAKEPRLLGRDNAKRVFHRLDAAGEVRHRAGAANP